MTPYINVFADDSAAREAAIICAERLNVPLNHASDAADYQLHFTHEGVYLKATDPRRHGRIQVDFCTGGAAHRRLYGGGKGQMIAKAAGLTAGVKPRIFDATAGLGGDAFVLACLGCPVIMMERSPVAFALLQDGLERARHFAEGQDADLEVILGRMQLLPGDSIAYLQSGADPVADVIYLDPMFPERQKSAAVKKEMQAFHAVVGQDEDDGLLLHAALKRAIYRVVAKRPRHAPPISGQKPHFTLEGKSSRYDIYTLRSMSRPS